MVFKSQGFSGGDGDAGVFEDDGPFGGIVDPFADIGGIVGVPCAGGGETKVNRGIGGNVENSIRSICPLHYNGSGKRGTCEGGGEDCSVFHGNELSG